MTVDRVLVSRSPGETRVALMAGDRLVELLVQRAGAEAVAGNVYLGRVESVVGGLEAAFVDIGLGRAGFLALAEARPPGLGGDGTPSGDRIGDYVREGDAVLVQVQREPQGDKGAKLTMHPSFVGAELVLRPDQPGVSVSRRITDEDVRRRLLDAVEPLAPEGGGFIVRTAAADAADGVLEAEAAALAERWRHVRLKRANSRAPALLLAEPSIACRALRDCGPGISEIIADDAEAVVAMRAFGEAEMPALTGRIEAWPPGGDLFETLGVEAQIEAALRPQVALPGGGSVIVSETPALTAIDVNTGGADAGSKEETAYAVDLEAADEIARQVRLRSLSGLIVVDFAPVKQTKHREGVLARLRNAVADDPAGPFVVGHTRMGLVEMTRRRHGPSLAEIYVGEGAGHVAPEPRLSALSQALAALRGVLREAGRAKTAAAGEIVLAVPPAVADLLGGRAGAALDEARSRLGVEIRVRADQSLADGHFEVTAE